MNIPSYKIDFTEEDIRFIIKNLRDILHGKIFFSQYKFCEEFEKKFAQYIGTKYAVSVTNGTCALEIILRTLKIEGKEVIVPTNTFAATAFAVIHAGGVPVFADCQDDLTIDPKDVMRRITKRTKAIITVHIGGFVSPSTKELVNFCRENGLYLVEDAAHAHGSMLGGRKAGSFGIASGFSFFSTKVMTTGEGGMIATDDENIYKKAVVLRDQAKIKKGIYQNYQEEIGNNWRMLEVTALLGLRQLKRLEHFIQRRTHIAEIYNRELVGVKGVSVLKIPPNLRTNYYKYTLFLDKINRETLQGALKEKYHISLGGYVYEIPLHKLPAFKRYSQNIKMSNAERLCATHICLPIYSKMTTREAFYTINSFKKCLK